MRNKSGSEQTGFDRKEAFARFETSKRKNFSNSSKLEGINQPEERLNTTLEGILSKYKVSG